jgi:hypothetical protein
MNGPLEEQASLERMRAQLVGAENALAKAELAKADEWLEEASTTSQHLGPRGTEWNEGGIELIRDLLSQSSIKQAREGLSRLITNLDDRIEGPGD